MRVIESRGEMLAISILLGGALGGCCGLAWFWPPERVDNVGAFFLGVLATGILGLFALTVREWGRGA